MYVSQFHTPVLVQEVIQYLITNKSGIYVDCTIGGGGHSLATLESLDSHGKLIGIDGDEEALSFSRDRLAKYGERVILKYGNFAQITEILKEEGIAYVDGILFDLGVSSHQIDSVARGFSYLDSGPLDMRMNTKNQITAESILNKFSKDELVDMFKGYGEEKYAKSIATAIIFERQKKPISNTLQLSEIIVRTVPYKFRIKSLSRIFQALRIQVNQELKNLSLALDQSIQLLKTAGRLIVISYHSLEDKIVKNFFQRQANPCTCPPEIPTCICHKTPLVKILTRHAIKPAPVEIKDNPRSRSARLRAVEKA